MKNLAVLSESFPPTNIVGALRPFRLVKHICRRGWNVEVLTHPPSPAQNLDEKLLNEINGSFTIHYITRPRLALENRPVVRRRVEGAMRDFFRKWVRPDPDIIHVPSYFRTFQSMYLKKPVDVLLTTSPAHSMHLAGLWIRKKIEIPWIVDFRDPWDYYPSTGRTTIDNSIERFLEKKILTTASAVVSTTDMYTDILKSRHKDLPGEKFFTITNTFDRHKTGGKQSKSPDKFIICYTGIFYADKDPYGFFRALSGWFKQMTPEDERRYKDRLEVHLVGSGDGNTRRVIFETGLEKNVIFFERMSHEQAVNKTLQADMALISTGTGPKTRPGWLPSKLFEYLGCRLPIIAFIREGEMSKIIRETNSGFVLSSENPEELAAVIRHFMDQKFFVAREKNFNCCTFEGVDRFEEEKVMSKYISIIEKIT